ncbi:MAG: PTS sugar transporter subunit IIA [Chitinivibrionales bacterium]|nr:PTS sugar transporter subunit IIA [Chitinivibrionales bacterium]
MQLTVKEASRLLKLSESAVYRLIRKKEIPAYPVGKSYLFNRVELFEWAIAKNITVSPEVMGALSDATMIPPTLGDALAEGGVYFGLDGGDKQSVLKAVVEAIQGPQGLDKEALLAALMARELLASTAIGNGIAIPHVRNPVVLNIEKPLVVLSFLKTPVDFSALDGRPVDTLFTLISTTVRVHLHLLARLSFLLHNSAVQSALAGRGQAGEIIKTVRTAENTLIPSAAPAGPLP